MTNIPQEPNTGVLNDLLTQAFMDESDLRRFCRDTPGFRPVLGLVSVGTGFQDHVDTLIRYCQTHLLFDELLAGVERVNPRQYARFAPLLGQRVPAGQEDLATPLQDDSSESLAEQPVTTPAVSSATTDNPFINLLSAIIAAVFPDLVKRWNEWLAKRGL